MLKKIILTTGLLAACTVMSAQAHAQSYFGGSVGRDKWNFDCAGTVKCQTSAASVKLFGGYRINQYFAVEASHLYFNEVTANNGQIKLGGRGLDIAGVVKTLPMNHFTGFAKLGLSFMKGEILASTLSNYSSQPLVGVGVMYDIDEKVKVRAEIDRRKVKVSSFVNTTYAVTNFSIGLQSEF